jgi:Uma2 family endonuclease
MASNKSAEKHELWDGEVYPMAGASLAHNWIVANLVHHISYRTIIEVLSPSTEAFDRGQKSAGYRSIPSVDEIRSFVPLIA